MTTTLRVDDDLKRECEVILDDLGLNMSCAVTLFLRQIVKQRAIPFLITCDRLTPRNVLGRAIDDRLSERGRIAANYAREMRDNCDREWTMDEIDAEIAAARRERRALPRVGA